MTSKFEKHYEAFSGLLRKCTIFQWKEVTKPPQTQSNELHLNTKAPTIYKENHTYNVQIRSKIKSLKIFDFALRSLAVALLYFSAAPC